MRAEKLRRRQLPFRIAGDLGGLQTAVLVAGVSRGMANSTRAASEKGGKRIA
jgi:hypothetical protein